MPLLNPFQQCGIPTWPEPAGKSGHVEPFKFSGNCALSRYIKTECLNFDAEWLWLSFWHTGSPHPTSRGMTCMLMFFIFSFFVFFPWMTVELSSTKHWLYVIRRVRVESFKDLTHFIFLLHLYLHDWVKIFNSFSCVEGEFGLASSRKRDSGGITNKFKVSLTKTCPF